MLKVLLWIVSNDNKFLNDALKILERQHNGLEPVGKAVGENITEIDRNEADILLVVGARNFGMSKIVNAARQLNLPEEKLLGDWIVCIPGFTLEKYRQLQHSRLSIFSLNCFGGVISNTLGLPFRSPFVNMFFHEDDFIRFLRAPHVYLEKQLVLKGTAWEDNMKFDYPIFALGDVEIHMNHYRDFDEAVKTWERRRARINRYNLFVTMYTDREEISAQFDELPHGKKVCFVPFKSDLASAWYINPELADGAKIQHIVTSFGAGKPFYFDVFDMLLYGKKTPLIEM